MRAFRCDCCGKLVPVEEVVQVLVSLPSAEEEDGTSTSEEWQQIDICGTCLDRPAREVVEAACIGFDSSWAKRKMKREEADS